MALEPHSFTAVQKANKLWLCCCKELQKDMQNLRIAIKSIEQDILAKVLELAVKTP